MNIIDEISNELWEEISTNYNNEKYSKAVEDAFFQLTKILRSSTGDTDDGAKLVRKALSGDNPPILLNNQITQSEIDYQRGIMDITIGMYTAIRNPLIHEKLEFTKEESDLYLCIINYLIDRLQNASKSFDLVEILSQLKDPMYVQTSKYSKSLIDQIGKNRYLEVLNTILNNINKIPFKNLSSFLPLFLNSALKKDEKVMYRNISKKLGKSTEFSDHRILLTCIPPAKWDMLDLSTRIRIENIIKEDINNGLFDKDSGETKEFGALSTWVEFELLNVFENKEEICEVLIEKLRGDNVYSVNYVNEYFLGKLFEFEESMNHREFINLIKEEFKKEESDVIEYLREFVEFNEEHPWREIFKMEMEQSKIDFSPIDLNDIL